MKNTDIKKEKSKRRILGVHLTSQEIFNNYIFPEIKDYLYDYIWIDLYCGEGNLIFPILDNIPSSEREDFFRNHIYLSDIQPQMIQKCIEKAINYGISLKVAQKNIFINDNLANFPKQLKNKKLPLFHITNPPYLYLGYIRKHKETENHLKYFENENKGYQDLYQIAMINDLRNNIKNLIYIIPTNFLFGAAVSNKFRMDFLKYYQILKTLIFEVKVFEFTGTNICINFFKKKKNPGVNVQKFRGIKFKKKGVILERIYELNPSFKYRAGAEFDIFTKEYRSVKPIRVKYYLTKEEVEKNKGNNKIIVIDTNKYLSNDYQRVFLYLNDNLRDKILSNILYIRTVDTGTPNGRAGLNVIRDDFKVDGIYVSKATYRTSPIQIFLKPPLTIEDQLFLRDYFNLILEYFREKLDSEFLTTYKYSDAEYTRKYLGLTQVRKLIETFPIRTLDDNNKEKLKKLINERDITEIFDFLRNLNNQELKSDSNTLNIWIYNN
ncbi:MAG: N-6 DNA methylase [Promethearchaeota archaeon]